MGKTKKFIDKKKSATFQLIARDSSDPNYDDAIPGNDRVFVRVDNNPNALDDFFPEDDAGDPDSIFADAPEEGGEDFGAASRSIPGRRSSLPDKVRREILELGFPDDGYNYLLHLREIKNAGGGSAFFENPKAKPEPLPLDVKAYDASRVAVREVESNDANDSSIYGIAAKTVNVRVLKVVDPDVIALLDDSDLSRFGSDVDELEEDFVVQANLPEGGNEDEDEGSDCVDAPVVVNEGVNGLGAFGLRGNKVGHGNNQCVGKAKVEDWDASVEEKQRARRPLDEQFDLLERQEYETDDEDEYYGYAAEEDEALADKLKNVLNAGEQEDLELDDNYMAPADILKGKEKPVSKEVLDSAADLMRRCAEYAKRYENEDDHEDVVFVQESSDESEQWDCDTIVSTYSNLDNHPGRIGAPGASRKKRLSETVSGALNSNTPVIALRGREKMPVDFLPHAKKSSMEKVKSVSILKTEQPRRKQQGQESKEEKKERKAAVKEERREARRVKKEMKELYKFETQRAQRVVAVAGPSSIHLM